MNRRVQIFAGVFAILVINLFFSSMATGQGGATGAISGQVIDSSGSSVADAEVQIISTATDALVRKVSTGSDGTFVVTLLPPGTYYAVVNKSGFSEAKAEGIEVRVTETTKATIPLKPGSVSEKVEITAQVTSVETTNATTGQSLGTQTIRDLPLATQNYQQLLTLSSGAQSDLNAAAQLGRGNVRVIVNGQREDNNNYSIDGISATDYNVAQASYIPLPNPDVIQEFKVQTSLYDASQGRNGGGSVNAILKSGTRQYHGDAYEYFRNDVLNANDFFLNAAGQGRPSVKQNIFGGSLGGPVVKENLGFFFVNYQGTRQRSALSPGTEINNPGFPVLPSDDRSEQALINTFFPDGLPAGVTGLDPVSVALLNFKSNQFGDPNGFLIPTSNGVAGQSGSLIVSKPGKYTDDQFTANWDREFHGGQDKIGVRFFFSDAESLLPFGAGGLQASLGGTLASSISATDLDFPYDIPVKARFFSVNETHLFSPTLVNDFRFGFVHINDSLINIPPVTASDLGINRPTNSVTSSIYKFTFGSSGFQIGPTPPADQFQNQDTFNFTDTVSWVKGPHVFRIGGEFTHVKLDKIFPQVFNGQLFFVNDSNAGSDPNSITDWQKFLIGAPDFSFGGGGVDNHEYRTNDFSVFAQDDWKIRHDLTLNLGLRVEELGAFHDDLCHIGNLDVDLANSGQYPFINGKCANKLGLAGLTGSGSDTTYKNAYSTGLAPRIGFAYDLGGKHTTTVRGGFGIYFVREDVGTVDQLSFQAPYLPVAFGGGAPGSLANFFQTGINALPQAGVLDPNFIPCLGVFQGFPGGDTTQFPNYGCASGSPGVLPSQDIFGLSVPRDFKVPNTQQWNLTIQRSLGKNWVLEVGYVGTHAVHLRETRTSIQASLASPSNPIVLSGANCDGSVIDPSASCPITIDTAGNGAARSNNAGINGYGGFQLFANDAYSHYHSLQTTLSRRWGKGYFQGAYTWSKSTDATSSGNTALNTAFNDETDLKNSRGLSDFDRTHRLVVSYRYDLPFFASAEGIKKAALSGWAISGISIFQSGSPFSVTDSAAGTAFLGAGLASATLGGQLAPGANISGGLSSGSIHDRVNNGYLNGANFTTAPILDPSLGGDGSVTIFGNLGRNIYRGPFQQNWDFSLLKSFAITERQSIRFTADFFNVWNHVNFANPTINDVEVGTGPNSPFGKIFSTVGTPRLIQFSLRYSF